MVFLPVVFQELIWTLFDPCWFDSKQTYSRWFRAKRGGQTSPRMRERERNMYIFIYTCRPCLILVSIGRALFSEVFLSQERVLSQAVGIYIYNIKYINMIYLEVF